MAQQSSVKVKAEGVDNHLVGIRAQLLAAFGADHLAHPGKDRQQIVGLGDFLKVAGAAGLPHFLLYRIVSPALGRQFRQEIGIHLIAGHMGNKVAHRHFGKLADHSHMSRPPHFPQGAAFQGRAAENAGLDVSHIRQIQTLAGIFLAAGAGGQDQVGQGVGRRHINRQMDAGPPGGGGKGLHYAGAAQDGDAAQDAQAGISGFGGDFRAARHRQLHYKSAIGGQSLSRGRGGYGFGNHPPGDAGNGRFPHRYAGAGPGHRANALAANNADAAGGIGRIQRNGGADFRAVGNIRIIAAILDHGAGYGIPGRRPLAADYRKGYIIAHRQMDGYGGHRAAAEQGQGRRFGGGGGAGAGSVAGPQPPPFNRLAAVVAFRPFLIFLFPGVGHNSCLRAKRPGCEFPGCGRRPRRSTGHRRPGAAQRPSLLADIGLAADP